MWRKFCKKCGKDVLGFRIQLAEESLRTYELEVKIHQDAIKEIREILPSSKIRLIVVQALFILLGIIVSFAFDSWVVRIGGLSITCLFVYFYESSEIENLEKSLQMHAEDIDRLKEKSEANLHIISLLPRSEMLSSPSLSK